MKLLIAVDMEGVTGVVGWNHVLPTHPEYQRFRHLMTADVNAAVRGAIEGGADQIIVADGHSSAENILVEELDPRAQLNSGAPSQYAMVQGIDQEIDAALFIGYHARAGAQAAVLDHTWSRDRVQNVWLNERLVGEIGLNASLCGHFNVPVLLLSGDQSANLEASEWIPGIENVVIKQATGHTTAMILPPAVTQKMIAEAAARAVINHKKGQAPAPLHSKTPVQIRIEFKTSYQANWANLVPGSRMVDGRTIEIVSADMAETYRAFRAAVMLAGS